MEGKSLFVLACVVVSCYSLPSKSRIERQAIATTSGNAAVASVGNGGAAIAGVAGPFGCVGNLCDQFEGYSDQEGQLYDSIAQRANRYYSPDYYSDYDDNRYDNYEQRAPSYGINNYNYNYANNFDPFALLDHPFQLLNQFQQRRPQVEASDRFGGPYYGSSYGSGFTGVGSSSTFSNSGRPSYTSTSIQVGPDGHVTTLQQSSGQPDKVTTGRINPNARGVFAASGVTSDSNGRVDEFRHVGTIS